MYETLTNFDQVKELLLSGFMDWGRYGIVKARYDHEHKYVLFSYAKGVYRPEYNWFESVSRGLVMNYETGEIVARPFDKFFNWGEQNKTTDAKIKRAYEKVDGSLLIAFVDKYDGVLRAVTRGSFDSQQARVGLQILKDRIGGNQLLLSWTYLLEVIYPSNKSVVNYGGKRDTILLAIRNNETGEYMSWEDVLKEAERLNLNTCNVYEFSGPKEIVKTCEKLSNQEEGFVVEFEDGSRFKFKSLEYLKLHKDVWSMRPETIVDWHRDGVIQLRTYNLYGRQKELAIKMKVVMDERIADVRTVIETAYNYFWDSYVTQFGQLNARELKKCYSEYVLNVCADSLKSVTAYSVQYLFMRYDSKDMSGPMYRNEFGKEFLQEFEDYLETTEDDSWL